MQINSDSNKTKSEKEEKRKRNQIEKEDTTKWAEIKEQRSTEATLARVIISWVDVTTPVIQYANTSVVLPTVRVAMQIDSVWAPMRHALPATISPPPPYPPHTAHSKPFCTFCGLTRLRLTTVIITFQLIELIKGNCANAEPNGATTKRDNNLLSSIRMLIPT